MGGTKFFYRRNLPHYQPSESTYFITFRLAGSLPREVIIRLREERIYAENLLRKIRNGSVSEPARGKLFKRSFVRFDKLLETASNSPYWLLDARIAKIVSEAIHFRDNRQYELIAYCVMPIHVHMVCSVLPVAKPGPSGYIVTNIIGSLKKYTAREANRVHERSGPFWQHESYDHVVRNERKLVNITRYVIDNPVKAGFVSDWQQWRWSYLKPDL